MIINGVDLAAYGFTYQRRRLPGFAGERTATAPLPGAYGSTRTGGSPGPATLSVEWTVVATDRTHATLVANLRAIEALLRDGVAIRFADRADCEWHGYLQTSQWPDEIGPAEVADGAQGSFEFQCPDPLAAAQTETVLPGSDVTLSNGTAPAPLRIDVQNVGATAMTQIVVTVMAGARVLSTLTWNGSLAAGAVWSVDDESWNVTVAGVWAGDGLTADSVYPVADPAQGATRVVISSTGGTASAVLRYFRRWGA